jgi:hypothetical protein
MLADGDANGGAFNERERGENLILIIEVVTQLALLVPADFLLAPHRLMMKKDEECSQ